MGSIYQNPNTHLLHHNEHGWREQIMPNIVQQKLPVDLIRARMIDELFKRYVYQLRDVACIHSYV